jgi:hypothetical protein
MTNQTVELNENLVKIDKLLKGLEFLYEEITTRKEEMIKATNIENIVKTEMKSEYFMNEMSYYIRNHYGDGISREVSYIVMDRIDREIDTFINSRVNAALNRAGVNPEVANRTTNSSTSGDDVRYEINGMWVDPTYR